MGWPFYLEGPGAVVVSREAVAAFNKAYPGSKLDSAKAYRFGFDEDGALTSCSIPLEEDGPWGVQLSEDCVRWLEQGTTPAWAKQGEER